MTGEAVSEMKDGSVAPSRAKRPPWSGRRTRQLCVTIDPETLGQIDRVAVRGGQNRSQWVRDRLEWALMDAEMTNGPS